MPVNRRIWELDLVRGLCILGMVMIHLIYDLVELTGLIRWEYPPAFLLLKNCGSVVFLLLSGVCVTLGSHSTRRGIVVLLSGMAITAVTAAGKWLGLSGDSFVVRFGILHCLGCCMLLWGLFKDFSPTELCAAGAAMALIGTAFASIRISAPYLYPLGLTSPNFRSGDYFPLLPNLGFFLLGSAVGMTGYRQKETRFPRTRPHGPGTRFLIACGRHSLPIYLLHQPVILGILCFIPSFWRAFL